MILQGQEPAAGTRATLLAELQARLIQERAIYTDEHPNVMAVRRQIEALEAEIATESAEEANGKSRLDPAVVTIQREVDGYRTALALVEQQIHELDTAVAAIPAREEKLAALQQQEQILLERYVGAVRKVQEAELAESLQRSQQGFQVSLVDAAVVPSRPLRSPLLMTALAAAAVFGVSVLSGFLLELIDPVIVASRQLEVETGMPLLGVVPRIR